MAQLIIIIVLEMKVGLFQSVLACSAILLLSDSEAVQVKESIGDEESAVGGSLAAQTETEATVSEE